MFNQSSLSNLFAPSPMKPLQQHMAQVHQAVTLLRPFVDALIQEQHPEASLYYEKIVDCERAADAMKYDLRAHLPRHTFLSVPRADILDLLRTQDKLANTAKDIAGLMLGRKMSIPEPIAPSLLQLLDRCIDASALAHETISHLGSLQEAGFQGKEVSLVETMIRRIDDIEQETDHLQIGLRQSLLKIEAGSNPIDMMFLYKIANAIGEIADLAQSTGHRLLLLMSS